MCKSQFNALKILSKLPTPQGDTNEGKGHPLSTGAPCPPPKFEGPGQPAQLERARCTRSFSFVLTKFFLLLSQSVHGEKKSVAAVTLPPESFFGTPNTRSEGNPETLSSPCTHPSLLGTKGPMTSGNLMPQTLSYKGFLHISGTMPESSRPQAIEDHFHNRVNQALARILHALQSCVRCHHYIFQMLFQQFQSCFISSQNGVFAFWVMKILSPVSFRLHLPKGLRCLTSFGFLTPAALLISL